MSLPDQLVGWPETQEQLRKPAALFSDVKRISVQRERAKVMNWSFISRISLSGIF